MPTSGSGHHHRSSSLRQTNKKNKRSKSSKRSLTKAAGGKITAKSAHHQNTLQQTKADRKHHQVQLREAKKQERLRRLRGWVASSNDNGSSASSLSSAQRPPRVVGILSLGSSPHKMEEQVRTFLLQGADVTHPSDLATSATSSGLSTVSARYLAHKKDGALTLLTNSTAFAPHYLKTTCVNEDDDVAVLAALDLCRVCDMILFVIDDDDSNTNEEKEEIMNMNIGSGNSSTGRSHSASTIGQEWDHLISARGDKILAAIKAQGLPTPLTVLAHTKQIDNDDDNMTFQSAKSLNRSAVKRRQALKRFASRFATTEFGTDGSKVLEVDLGTPFGTTSSEGANENEDEVQMEDADDDDRTAMTGTGGGLSMTTSKAARQSSMAAAAFIRTVCTMAASPPKWVSELPRPYLLADQFTYDDTLQELQLTGHVRGRVPLNVNSLFHIPNMGIFQCKSISRTSGKHGLFKVNRNKKAAMEASSTDDDKDIITPNPDRQESLTMFATPDALEGEQNLIGFDEADEDAEDLDEDDAEHNNDESKKTEGFARPAGWSDYQSAWLDGIDNEDGDNNEGTVGPGDFDHGELAKALNQPGRRNKGADSAGNSVFAADQMDLDEANQVTKEERSALLEQRRKDQSEHLNFPDEVQVNEDENARDRFARYRALKSFKKTFWDPKENLPESYASIFHFASFKATQSNIIKDMKDKVKAANACDGMFWGSGKRKDGGDVEMEDEEDENDDVLEGCVPVGAFVTVTLKVPKESFTLIDSNAAIAAVALLQHENKVSVLHMGLNRPAGFLESGDAPIKSKDLLTFRCGWRTWQGRPVFSQNNINCDKHKFERYLPAEGSFFAASVFGPVTYTPCPVLVFRESREQDSAKMQLVALGSMIGADADRIVVKRIVLTGFPVKVQKRFATVKYMFYNPDDVRWFKPADLTTKHGLHGNIMESVGEHGTMKCLFNAPIKQHDTVCLQLYKRIYPKFVGASDGDASDRVSVQTSNRNQKLVVW